MRKLKNIKCPLCKKSQLSRITEVWNGQTIEFNVSNGRISETGNVEPGDPVRLIASCDACDHEWILKGVFQISQIDAPRYDL